MLSRFQNNLDQIVVYDLINKFNYKHNYQLPKITSISINISDSSLVAVKSKILNYLYLVRVVTNQTPKETVSRKNKIHLKIKKNAVIGCKVDLNLNNSLQFLEHVILFIAPQIKNFSGFSCNEKNQNQISFHIREWYKLFPNVLLNKINLFNKNLSSLQITIKFKSKSYNEVISVLNSLNFPIK